MTVGARILVVDDEEGARETIEAQLYVDRYELELVSDAAQALEVLEARPVELVICDALMPGIDGFEMCRRMKSHPTWRYIPVILATALDGVDDLVRGLDAGADELLHKPLSRIVLRARVRAMLRIRELYRSLTSAPPDVDALLRARRERVIESAGLSAREREILDLLLLGRSHEEIGMVLGISARTSKFHQARVLAKLGADSRVDLLRLFS